MNRQFRISGKSFKRSASWLLAVGVVLILAVWINLISTYKELEEQTLADMGTQTANLAEALRLQTDSILRGVDTIAIQLRREYQTRANTNFKADTRNFIENAMEGFAVQVVIVDAKGNLAWSSENQSLISMDLGDRAYFFTHAQNPEQDKLYVGKPILNRLSHRWTIPVSRPLLPEAGNNSAEDNFRGVIMISLDPYHFANLLRRVDLGKTGVTSMFTEDGTFLVRSTMDDNWIGKQIPETPPFLKPGASEKGTFRIKSPYDGIDRICAYQHLPEYGITVVTGLGVQEALAPIHRKARNSYSVAFLVTLTIATLFIYLFQLLRRHGETEAELESEHRILREAERIGQVGSWQWDLTNNQFIGSEQLHRMFCFEENWGAISAERFQDTIHPQDRERVREAMRRARAEGTPLAELEYRILCHDGQERIVLACGEHLDNEGKPQMIGTLLDVTELRASQKQLNQAKIVFDNAQEAVVVSSPDGVIQAVNPAFERITGYRAQDAIGKKTNLLSSGRHSPAFFAAMWTSLREEGHWAGEIWNRRRDGSLYVEWLTIQTVYDDKREPLQYVALFSDITDRKRQEEAVWHRAYHDALTGLPNRSLFQDRLEHAITSTLRDNCQLGLLFIDLDHFKEVNDLQGHASGDDLLKQVAERLQASVRASDTVARLAGDEFMVLVEGVSDRTIFSNLAGKILKQLSTPFILSGQTAEISASIGISIYPQDGQNVAALLHAADLAMYEAKRAGRNAYAFASAAETGIETAAAL